MGQLINFGDRVQKIGIDRFDCAQDVTVKAMFVNYDRPYARNMAYDETNKCYVECDKDMAIKYGLSPKPRYYFLVAALQTDMNGNILGDKEVKVTYVNMSNNQYEHFLAASNNLDQWKGFVTLVKVKKNDGKGKDIIYIEATPASSNAQGFKGISEKLAARLNQLAADENMLNTAVQLIDADTGLTKEQYEERLAQKAVGGQQPQAVQGGNTMYVTSQPAPQAIPQPTAAPVAPTTTTTSVQDLPTEGGDIKEVTDLPFS